MDSNYDSGIDSDSDFELPEEVFENLRENFVGVPMKRLVQVWDYYNTQLELMTEPKEDQVSHYYQYSQKYFKINDETDDLELRLEKLKEVEKLTHYAGELDALFLKLYPLRKDPEKLKEMQFVVSQRNLMKIFQQNYDIFMTTIRSLEDKLKRMSRKAERVVTFSACCLPSENRTEILGKTWEPEDAERRLHMVNLLIGLRH